MEKYYVNYGPHYELELLSKDEIENNPPERYCTASVHLDVYGNDDVFNGTVEECEEFCKNNGYTLGEEAVIEVENGCWVFTHDILYKVDWMKDEEVDVR